MKINYFSKITTEKTIKEIVDLILKKRKIDDINEFIYPTAPKKLNLLKSCFSEEVKKAIKILKEVKKKNEMIVIYTDYDADGITGGAILWETLYLLGFKVMPYVPDRIKEGYGFSFLGINNVIKQFKPKLIISVDQGITKIKEVDYLCSNAIKVIITDHHLKGEKLPKADVIFHIPELSGSGVAYFFAYEIFQIFTTQTLNNKLLKTNFESDYLSLAAIGTIADLVPLIGPSRSIVKFGLEAINKTKRLGIKHILKEAGINNKLITPYDISFIIAPRINAVGRLEHAIDALRLLCTIKENRAYQLAHKVSHKNIERQTMVKQAVSEAKIIVEKYLNGKNTDWQKSVFKKMFAQKEKFIVLVSSQKINSDQSKLPKIIILISHHWHEGIIGLIASKIAEEYYRPTIVMTKTDGFYKGSARSIPNFHITNFLKSLKKNLIDVGGHQGAAGFTIEEKQLDNFCSAALNLSSSLIKNKDLERKIAVDLKIPVSKITLPLAKTLEKLAPFGIGNPEPLFYSQAVLTSAKIFGKNNEHLKILVEDENSVKKDNFLEIIFFNQGHLFSNLNRKQKIKLIYTLEINRFNEKEKVRGKGHYLFLL